MIPGAPGDASCGRIRAWTFLAGQHYSASHREVYVVIAKAELYAGYSGTV